MLLFILQLDAYWTYELCHGRHIKQFHELKAGVPVCMIHNMTVPSILISVCTQSLSLEFECAEYDCPVMTVFQQFSLEDEKKFSFSLGWNYTVLCYMG